MVYAEQVLAILVLAFLVIVIELKLRVISQQLAQTSVQSIGIGLIFLGGLLLLASAVGYVDQKYALYVIIGGFAVYIIGWILRKLQVQKGLEIETEKREYLKRVRKGLTIEDAETKAEQYLKTKVREGLKKISSQREFKTWKIYFSGRSTKKKYVVIVDMDGEIMDWETLKELPSWMEGPY